MPRDAEDMLFAEEMALSTRRYRDAVARGTSPRSWAGSNRRVDTRARSRQLVEQSLLLRETARAIAAESAAILEKSGGVPTGEPHLSRQAVEVPD